MVRIKYDPILQRFKDAPYTGQAETITRANLITLRDAGDLEQGKWYLATGCTFYTGYTVDVLLQATESDKLSRNGVAKFFNPIYVATGNYKGQWYSAMAAPTASHIYTYNGLHYTSITGAVGTAPSGDAVNWSTSTNTRNTANGYVVSWDKVVYNIDSDLFYARHDQYNNEVSGDPSYSLITNRNLFRDFQWGNPEVHSNRVVSSQANIRNWWGASASTEFKSNTVLGGSTFSFNLTGCSVFNNLVQSGTVVFTNPSSGTEKGKFENNFCTNGGGTSCITSSNYITNCVLDNCTIQCESFTNTSVFNYSVVRNTTITPCSNGTVEYCHFTAQGTYDITSETGFSGKRLSDGYSDLGKTFTITGLTTLAVSTTNNWVGIITASSTNGTESIDEITDLPSNHPVKIVPASGLTLTMNYTAIGSAAANDIVSAVADKALVGRTNGADEVVLIKDGNLNKRLYSTVLV